MADGVKVTVRNKDKLLAKLNALAPGIKAALTESNKEAADEMVRYARSFVPVKTGKLRDSIVATPPGGTVPGYSQGGAVPEGAYAVSAGNSKVRYPHLVEYGTRPHINEGMFAGSSNPGAKRQPYFWPAYRLIRKSMRSRASRAINKAVKTVASR